MIEVHPTESLALARARAPERSRQTSQILFEAAILVPSAVILWLGLAWNDRSAIVLGPLLYAGFQIYSSLARQRDLVRLGDLITRFETAASAPPPAEVGHTFRAENGTSSIPPDAVPTNLSPGDAATRGVIEAETEADPPASVGGSVLPLSPRLMVPQTVIDPTPTAVADLFDDAAEESRIAARHLDLASRHFRRGKIPRGCAHAFAAEGNLRRAMDAIATGASVHTDRAGFEE